MKNFPLFLVAIIAAFVLLGVAIGAIARAEGAVLPDGIAQDKTLQQHDERLRYEAEKEALRLQYTEFCAVVPAGPTQEQLMQAFQALPKEAQPAYAPFWQYMAVITQLRAERCHDDSH
jgi:hypothetical protein